MPWWDKMSPVIAAAADWVIVLPVKDLSRAKSRLSPRTGPDRRALALAFALDTVSACLSTAAVGRVVVVSSDPLVAAGATDLGADVVPDAAADLNGALLAGAATVTDDTHWTGLLAADLPALRAVDLAEALRLAYACDRAFVSDSGGTGTTLVTFGPGVPIESHFGPRSRAAHAAAGFVELRSGRDLSRLRCDVDTEVDLWHAQTLGLGRFTRAALGADGS